MINNLLYIVLNVFSEIRDQFIVLRYFVLKTLEFNKNIITIKI